MKIAVSSTGKSPDSEVDQRFGRAASFAIVDTETMDVEILENASVAAAGGAGINSAKMVADAGAEVVLTGNCGPNAERTLSAAGIKLYTGVAGTVTEAIEQFKAGKLDEASGPNVQAHWGIDT
jgi:predicted Fe-Mo cluster-binding NifX family protein